MAVETLVLFFGASLALGLTPGPDNLFVLTQSTQQGARAGLLVTLGLCTGLVVHSLLVAFGLAVIFQQSIVAFTALKLVGAAFLVFLAVQAFRAEKTEVRSSAPAGKLYLRGIIMNITNPKVAIFFLAFLPQFADPAEGALAAQILVLGGLFIIATLIVFGSIALLSGYASVWLRKSETVQRYLNWLAGAIFIGLAVRLIFTER